MSDIMWYEKSVREELIEKILDRMPKSVRKGREVRRYAHEYAYKLKLGVVRPGDDRLVEKGIEQVYKGISQSENK